jgi:hypothetical protein
MLLVQPHLRQHLYQVDEQVDDEDLLIRILMIKSMILLKKNSNKMKSKTIKRRKIRLFKLEEMRNR